MKKFFCMCLITLFTAVTLMAGGSQEAGGEGAPEEIEISFGWWGPESRHAYTQELADTFAEMNPGVTFTYQPNSWDGYWEKIATQAAAGALPTVMQFADIYIPTYARNGLFLDLTPYVEDEILDVSAVDKKLLDTGYFDGKLVSIPLSMSARAVTYSPNALQEAGLDAPPKDWTWDDFVEMCKIYTERTGNYALDGYSNSYEILLVMLLQRNYKLYDASGTRLAFADEKPLIEYFSFWEELVKNGSVYTPDVNVSMSQLPAEQSLIAQEKAAFIYNANTYPSWTKNENLKLAPVPVRVVGEYKSWSNPGMSFSISSSADPATAKKAVELVSWWLNSEDVAMVQGTDRGLPASKRYQDYLKAQPDASSFQKDTFEYFAYLEDHSGPKPPLEPQGNYEIRNVLEETLEEVLFETKTPAEAAATFFAKANEILARNK